MKHIIFLAFATTVFIRSFAHAARPADTPTKLHDLGEPAGPQIVATLDAPIEKGKNAVWCASFVAAWKHLQNDLASGTAMLDGARDVWLKLNEAADPTHDIPESALYATAGFESAGIRETILKEVAARFPGSSVPKLPDPLPNGFIAYARLQLSATFPVPYASQPDTLLWTDASGASRQLKAFGVAKHNDLPARLSQPRVYYTKADKYPYSHQFILNLNNPFQPTQIWIAQIPRKATLLETLVDFSQRCASQQETMGPRGQMLEERSALVVPEMAWKLQHVFGDLVGRKFTSGALRDGIITTAIQDMQLQLNKNGAEIKSDATLSGMGGGRSGSAEREPPSYYVTNPFLFMMWQRGADMPFFVAWIENDELLTKLDGAAK